MSRARFSLFADRVVIEVSTDTQSSRSGGDSKSWGTVVTRWAQVRPILGAERFEGQEVQTERTHEVIMRYDAALSGVVPKHRIKFGTRVLTIESVINEDERDRFLIFKCKEKT